MRPVALIAAVLSTTLALTSASAQERQSEGLVLLVGEAGLDEETGFVKIAGEVRNDTGVWIGAVRVDVDLLDADGRSLGVESIATAVGEDQGRRGALDFTYSVRDFVPPGETAPFQYIRDTRKIDDQYASHRLSVSGRPLAETDAPRAVIEAFSTETEEGGTHVARGLIRNAGTQGCRSPQVILTVYDTNGTLFLVEDETPGEYFQKVLDSGQSVEFTTKVYVRDETPVPDIRAIADCAPDD